MSLPSFHAEDEGSVLYNDTTFSSPPHITSTTAFPLSEPSSTKSRRLSHFVPIVKHYIVVLDLTSLRISDSHFAKLIPVVLEDTRIEQLCLRRNYITDSGILALTEQLKEDRCPSRIHTLILTHNLISVRSLSLLLSHLKSLTRLRRLEASVDEYPEYEKADFVVGGENREVENLEKCLLETFVYHGSYHHLRDPSVAHLVGQVLHRCPHLSTFYCVNTTFSAADDVYFSGYTFAHRGNAAHKASEEKEISTDTPPCILTKMCDSLAIPDCTLTSLKLRMSLSDACVELLCKELRRPIGLKKLILRHCDLTAQSLRLLGEALCVCETLTVVDFSYPHSSMSCRKEPHNSAVHESGRKEGVPNKAKKSHESKKKLLKSSESVIHVAEIEEGTSPLAPLIHSIQNPRSKIKKLSLTDVDLSIKDLEGFCDAIDIYQNRSLVHLSVTFDASFALLHKLETLISSNRLLLKNT